MPLNTVQRIKRMLMKTKWATTIVNHREIAISDFDSS